jgi:hypothetical protein
MVIKQYNLIKRFIPTETKMEFLTDVLLNKDLYLPDEYRDRKSVTQLLLYYLYGSRSLLYELGNWAGFMGFINIIPSYKCGFIMKLWDGEAWGFPLAKELKRFTSDQMKLYGLHRLELQTPDESGIRIAKIMGFVIEGNQKYGFRWNGKMLTNTCLRKIREI